MSKKGFSLIEVLVGVSLLAIGSIAALQAVRYAAQYQRSIAVLLAIEGARGAVRSTISAKQTEGGLPAACNAQPTFGRTFVDLRNVADAIFVASTQTTILPGGVKVRASCRTQSGFYEVQVQFKLSNPPAEAMLGKAEEYRDWKDGFGGMAMALPKQRWTAPIWLATLYLDRIFSGPWYTTNSPMYRLSQEGGFGPTVVGSDAATRARICELVGLPRVVSWNETQWRSCRNNGTMLYNPGTKQWVGYNACGRNNLDNRVCEPS